MKGERRHELKEDELTVMVGQWIDWLKKNHKPVGIGATLVVVVGLFVGWYVTNVHNAANQGWLRLSHANQELSMLRMSSFRRDADKKMLQETRTTLIDKYRQIARDVHGTEAALLASLQAGNLLFQHGNYTEAIVQFKAVKQQARTGLLAQLATRSLGYALEEKGQWDEAAREFADAAGMGGDAMAARSKLDEGRCLKKAGKLDAAKGAFKKAAALAPESGAAADAQKELTRMESAPPGDTAAPKERGKTEDQKEGAKK